MRNDESKLYIVFAVVQLESLKNYGLKSEGKQENKKNAFEIKERFMNEKSLGRNIARMFQRMNKKNVSEHERNISVKSINTKIVSKYSTYKSLLFN